MNLFLRIIKNNQSPWNLKLMHVIIVAQMERVSIRLQCGPKLLLAPCVTNNRWTGSQAYVWKSSRWRSREYIVLYRDCTLYHSSLWCDFTLQSWLVNIGLTFQFLYRQHIEPQKSTGVFQSISQSGVYWMKVHQQPTLGMCCTIDN